MNSKSLTPATEFASRDVRIRVGSAPLGGELRVPAGARGIVLFAHGSGGSIGGGILDERNTFIVIFRDRVEAGRQLAKRLMTYADRPDVLILALPRGGVPVGYEIARALNAPLDEFVAVMTPAEFDGVGQWYRDFSQTTDDEVCELLERASQFPTRN